MCHRFQFPFSSFVSAVLLVISGAACTEHPAREVVFAVGGAPAELAFWEMLADEFETKSGIPVRVLRRPSDTDQQRQSLIIALKANMSNPDVFLMDIAWIGLFSAADWLAPLENAVDSEPFFQHVIDRVDRRNGRLIALPVYMDAGMLYYRKDLLSQYGIDSPPDTWKKLIKTALRVQHAERKKNKNFYGFVWTGAQYEGLITVFMEFAGERGGFISEDGRIRLHVAPNVNAVNMMRDCIRTYGVTPPNAYTEMKEEEVRMMFQRSDALYERNWPYAWALHQSEGSPVRSKTGVSAVPAPVNGKRAATLGGFHIGISRFSDVLPEACEFVKFITSYRNQKRMAIRLGWNPGRRDLYEDSDVLAHAPHFKTLKEVFQQARPRPLEPYYTQISAIAQKHINSVLAGRADTDDALAAADREILDVLRRYGITKEK
ncbi:MAG: ABC transporter substrate-binding protein [Desulfobacterales bacterium]